MTKQRYIIIWNNGYGDSAIIVEAEDLADATDQAYENAKEDWESHADYRAEPWSEELADDYDLREDDE